MSRVARVPSDEERLVLDEPVDAPVEPAPIRFRERAGLDRRWVYAVAAVLVAALLYAAAAMRNRPPDGAEEAEAAAIARRDGGEVADGYPRSQAPAWAGAQPGRDSADAGPEAPGARSVDSPDLDKGDYVPLGRELGGASDTPLAGGEPAPAGVDAPGSGEPLATAPPDTTNPAAQRRSAYLRALTSRALRRGATGEAVGYPARPAAPGDPLDPGAPAPAESASVAASARRDSVEAERRGEAERARNLTGVPTAWGQGVADTHWMRLASNPRGRIVRAGTIISASLMTEVVSDLPGIVRAQVSRDVYDAEIRRVLIHAGDVLVGQQGGEARVGQNRLRIEWTALQLRGETIVLPRIPASDRRGGAGVPAAVDRHAREVFGDALLLSVLAVGVEAATSRGGAPTYPGGYPAPPAVSPAQPLTDAARAFLERNVKLQPTLRVPVATPVTVVVSVDLDLDAPPPNSTPASGAPRSPAGA